MSSKYTPTEQELEKLDNDFTYHAPVGDQQQRYEAITREFKQLSMTVLECCPPSPDRTVALRALRDARMQANQSIACNEREVSGEIIVKVL